MFIRRALSRPSPLSGRTRSLSSLETQQSALTDAIGRFRAQVWKASINERAPAPGLYNSYRHLRDTLETLPLKSKFDFIADAKDSLRADFQDALRLLSLSDSHSLADMLIPVVEDLTTKYCILDDSDAHFIILHALAESDNARVMYRWLTRHMKFATLEHWHVYLEHMVLVRGNKGAFAQALDVMSETGCFPTRETYILLLQKVFALGKGSATLAVDVIEIFASRGYGDDPYIRAFLLAESAKLGSPHIAAKIAAAHSPPISSDASIQSVKDLDAIGETFRKHGRTAAVQVYRQCVARGFQPTSKSLAVILKDGYTTSDVAFWQEQLNVKAEPTVWAHLITDAASRNPKGALAVFDEARALDVDPSFIVADVLVKMLCSTKDGGPPSDPSIRRAMNIYLDVHNWFCRDLPENNRTPSRVPLLPPGPETTAAQSVYKTLLNAFVASSSRERHFPSSLRMLKNLHRFIFQLNHSTLVEYVILAMRCVPDPSRIREVYSVARSFKDPSLGIEGCTAVLRSLLLEDTTTLPPWREFLYLVSRMREDGILLSAEIYTELLASLAHHGAKLPPTLADDEAIILQRSLAYAIRAIQHTLTTHAGVEPTAACLNQLIRTFSAVQCHDDAFRVWHAMLVAGQINQDSVTAILNTCAMLREPAAANTVIASARNNGFMSDRAIWYAWLECLCTCGNPEEAARILCTQMGRGEDAGVQPDEEIVRMVLAHAKTRGLALPIAERIANFLPALYVQLPKSFKEDLFGRPDEHQVEQHAPAGAISDTNATVEHLPDLQLCNAHDIGKP